MKREGGMERKDEDGKEDANGSGGRNGGNEDESGGKKRAKMINAQ